MKIILVLLLVTLALAEARRSSRRSSKSHSDFMAKHRKNYTSVAEKEKRGKIWAVNKEKVDRHNALYEQGKVSFSMTDNHLADQTIEELATGMKLPPVPENQAVRELPLMNDRQIPSFLNLTSSPCMAPIKNQAACGCCWAFAAVNPIEYQYCVKYGSLVRLSDQQLASCSNDWVPNSGCDGGWPTSAWKYIQNVSGIATEAAIPYTSGNGVLSACSFSPSQAVAQLSGYNYIQPNETIMAQVIATYGPLTVAIYVTNSFQLYNEGVFTDPTCPTGNDVNHGVTLIGYGNSTCGGAFWILRNQWGTNWGLQGYMLLARGVNMCNVALYPMIPWVA